MNGYLEEVRNSKDYNNYKLTADKVIQVLDSVREERTKSRRRWIWELMQNAKDVPNKYKEVSIEINLSESEFVFRHNGDPFEVGNITGLIQQVSYGKPSNNVNRRITGKFGTGFISTHLLSDTVTVEGVVEKESLPPKRFRIELNRKGETSEELIPAIKDELEKLNEIENFESIRDYHSTRTEKDKPTVFTYPLIDFESRKAAKIGIEDLANTLPQTLVFINDQIKSVKINNSIENIIVSYERVKFERITIINENEQIIYATIKSISAKEITDYNFIIFRNKEIDLAIRVNNFENKIVIVNDKSPKLFRDFPLVGSESFYFPFLLNGAKFFPTEKRDNVLLEGSEKKPTTNREIFEYTIQKAKVFAKWLVDNNVKELCSLAQSRLPDNISEESVQEWYKKDIQNTYREYIITLPIVETTNSNLSIVQAIIPKVSGGKEANQKFWNILSELYGEDKLCKYEHLEKWQKYVGPESEIKTWNEKIFYRIEDLLEKIQETENLESLTLKKSEIDKINWLNSVYQFLIDQKDTDFFKDYSIVLNRKCEFRDFDSLHIEKEGNIPNEFIEIYKQLKEDWDEILVHRELINIDDYHSSKGVKDISNAINTELKYEIKNSYGQVQKTFNQNEYALEVLSSILRIQTDNNQNSFQKQLFTLGKSFFKFEATELLISSIQDFDFNYAKKLFIQLLNIDIQKCEETSNIKVNSPQKWLDDYLVLLNESDAYNHLLKDGNIIPNRHNVLSAYDELYNFGTEETPLDEDLVSILEELNTEIDWNKILKADYISIKLPNTKKFDELANEIQKRIDEIRVDLDTGFEEYSNALLKLINWCSINDLKAKEYLSTFLNQKDNIFVNISLEDKEVGGNVMKLLQHKDKLKDLTEIAETGVDLSDLKELADISKIVGMDKIKKEAQKLQQEKEDFEFKKAIGEKIELALIEAFESENLNYNINYQGIGDKDIIITNPINSKEYYIEVKSLSPTYWDKDVRLSISQGKKAINCVSNGNYSLSILIRPNGWDNANTLFIKNNLKSILNVGTRLSDIISKNNSFESLIFNENEISLEFEDSRRKIKLTENYWKAESKDFDILIMRMKEYLK